MKRIAVLIKSIYILSGLTLLSCSFGGIATNPNETYTTTYNFPAERIVPYNNPFIENKANSEDVTICTGKASRNGFKCVK
ncbi:MAG: hypothetical protein K2X86_10025 [Cytophagaceae bacterium]|nr:hypothetical protein [Cytophagaceae bacterium]